MRVIVVGAGIVGVSIAHALIDDDHEVALLDRIGPAGGASRGNAGLIADSELLPMASAKMLRQVPRFLANPLGPLAIRPAYFLPLLPWLLRYLAAARPAAYHRSLDAILALQQAALPAWSRRVAQLGLEQHLRVCGMLTIFDTEAGAARHTDLARRQSAAGFDVQMLDRAGVKALEPALSARARSGAYVAAMTRVSDPQELTQALFDAALARGATFQRCDVQALRHDGNPQVMVSGSAIKADRVVIAAGAWSKKLAASLGDKIALDTERGYNVSFPGAAPLLNHAASFDGHGFVATPLETGLRVGGAVEFGGLHATPNHARSRALHAVAQSFLPDLPAYDTGTTWMGFRPSTPDSLPVIGPAARGPGFLYAFGHGHYGLTQAAVTAQAVADMVMRRAPQLDLHPYRANRF